MERVERPEQEENEGPELTWKDMANTWGSDYVYHLIGRMPTGKPTAPRPPKPALRRPPSKS